MNIAVQCADLEDSRVDGTRVYIWQLLRRFGRFSPQNDFFLYHRKSFNPALTPPRFDNYHRRRLPDTYSLWTQTRFARQLFQDLPDVLWMPMHALPFVLPSRTKTVVTVHDLAFKIFPQHFTYRDRLAQNILTDHAVYRADKLIAVSEATKKDLLRFYPRLNPEKVFVVHHGFDAEIFARRYEPEKVSRILRRYGLLEESYFLYTGALQPRKNLVRLIKAFEKSVREYGVEGKLVLAGLPGWLPERIFSAVENSPFKDRIVLTGGVSFQDLAVLLQKARIFVFPSLYEGFGLPILEAFAAGTPVVTADNSSLPEVAGDSALYCEAQNVDSITAQIVRLNSDEKLRREMILRGRERLKKFGWDKCAHETLDILTS